MRIYDVWAGLKRVYDDTLNSSTEICSWGSFDANSRSLPQYFRTYYRRRAKRGISMRSIHPDTPLARKHHKNDTQELRKSYLVHSDCFSLSPEIQVYDNKINLVSWRDRLGIIIESDELAAGLRSIFNLSEIGAKSLLPERAR